MYKTELHVHTKPVSNCAHVSPEDTVERFIENGYDSIVITNHMSPTLFNAVVPKDVTDWKAIADIYLDDYRRAKTAAGDRLQVLLGMELRVKANMNDYLIYGIDEQFVYDMGNIMDLKIKEISELVHDSGAVIFQAHPFRDNMTVTNPKYLDGIEVYNSTPTHNSRNHYAKQWAKEYDLIAICGTDFHREDYICGIGIETDAPITDSKQLAKILLSRHFALICP